MSTRDFANIGPRTQFNLWTATNETFVVQCLRAGRNSGRGVRFDFLFCHGQCFVYWTARKYHAQRVMYHNMFVPGDYPILAKAQTTRNL